jgi:hypothetical protein
MVAAQVAGSKNMAPALLSTPSLNWLEDKPTPTGGVSLSESKMRDMVGIIS